MNFSDTILCTAPETILVNQETQMLGYETAEMIKEQQIELSEQSRGEQSGSGEFIWYWDFGDGYTSSDKSPTHTYETPGNYQINLTVWDDDNIPCNFTQHVQVLNLIADYTTDKNGGHINETITFTDTSEHKYTITNWTWDFGDGNYSYTQNTEHSYAENNNYNVTLTVKDTQDNTHQCSQRISIEQNLLIYNNYIIK
ncbi:MAG: PKD domain-containing protein [Euryarchaeota archaeon]|nr:PKD domain-containing protein [Euryarchaeota archaeon]